VESNVYIVEPQVCVHVDKFKYLAAL